MPLPMRVASASPLKRQMRTRTEAKETWTKNRGDDVDAIFPCKVRSDLKEEKKKNGENSFFYEVRTTICQKEKIIHFVEVIVFGLFS